jgi:hypothetical protein
MQPSDGGRPVYRVKFLADTDRVSVLHIGMDCLDPMPDGDYDWDELPEWMRRKLAALATMHLPPPPREIDTVGQRISERVFWVYT